MVESPQLFSSKTTAQNNLMRCKKISWQKNIEIIPSIFCVEIKTQMTKKQLLVLQY